MSTTTTYNQITCFLPAHGFSSDACNDFSYADRQRLSILATKGVAMGTTTVIGDYATTSPSRPLLRCPPSRRTLQRRCTCVRRLAKRRYQTNVIFHSRLLTLTRACAHTHTHTAAVNAANVDCNVIITTRHGRAGVNAVKLPRRLSRHVATHRGRAGVNAASSSGQK